jgi:hypothetical protein
MNGEEKSIVDDWESSEIRKYVKNRYLEIFCHLCVFFRLSWDRAKFDRLMEA